MTTSINNKSSLKNKKVTVFDVARHAGVSKSTVSLVLTQSDKVSDKAKLKVEQSIEAIGYVYNREAASMRSRRSNLVAIVINDLTNPYSAQLAVGLEQHIRKMGLFSMLVNSAEDLSTQEQLVRNLKEYNVSAFIICPVAGTSGQWQNDLVSQGFPVINIMRQVKGANVPTVLPDNILGSSAATKHLIDKGYKKIVFIGGNENISDYLQRLAGFEQALVAAGRPFSKGLCIQSETNRHGGRQAMLQALTQVKDLDAVVCLSDVIAYGAIETLRAQDKQPGKDIAIVGFDDLADSCLMTPSLSTVRIDAEKVGAAVCTLLKKAPKSTVIEHEKDTELDTFIVPVELIIRASS
jgi:LacI family transcriptional regulator